MIDIIITKQCTQSDCRAKQPTDRSPSYLYEAPTTCYGCHAWNEEFEEIVHRVRVRLPGPNRQCDMGDRG